MDIPGHFTRANNARYNIEQYMTQDGALDMIIEDFVSREIEGIRGATNIENANIDAMKTNYFNASEFAMVQIPEQKRKNILQRAMQWIRERTNKNKEYTKTKESAEKIENNTIEKDDGSQR